jgi:ATP-dependent Lhr-like helicase
VLTREALVSEGVKGGFSAVYPALKAMDDAGRVRRGYFVAGLGATQFALPAAVDLLRAERDPAPEATTVTLAAVDPANPYGTSLAWPIPNLSRVAGATVILVDGEMTVYLARGSRDLMVHLPDDEPFRSRRARAAAVGLRQFARGDSRGRRALLVASINGADAVLHPLCPALEDAGFVRAGLGLYLPRAAHDDAPDFDAEGEPPDA